MWAVEAAAALALAFRHLLQQFWRDTRSAPGAGGQAHGAAIVLNEEKDALVEIDVPLLIAPNHLLDGRDSIDRANICAELTGRAEVVGPKIIFAVRDQWHVGQDIG